MEVKWRITSIVIRRVNKIKSLLKYLKQVTNHMASMITIERCNHSILGHLTSVKRGSGQKVGSVVVGHGTTRGARRLK